VRKDLPVKNIQELIALAKAKPGTINFATSNSKNIAHLTGAILAETPFEVDPTGVVSAEEWFTFAGMARLNGITALNAAIDEYPAARLLLAQPVDSYEAARRELDTFFQLSGGLRGHLAREYFREEIYGLGGSYVIEGEPGSLLDQLIINVEANYTPKRRFTNPSLSADYIEHDE